MRIQAKLGNMRKEAEFFVYQEQKDGRIIIQSGSRIACFDQQGNGLLSKHQSGGAYFLHLAPMCGATPVKVPVDVVKAALAVQPKSGDKMHGMVTFA